MKKWMIAIILLVVIGIVAFFMLSEKVIACQLFLDEGNAEVLRSGKNLDVKDEMELKKGDTVKVLSGDVVVVFYESDVMRLDNGAEVVIDNLNENDIFVKQNSGNTWNRVLGLTGVKQYNVETPNGVATVRGTGFGVFVSKDESSVIVDEGEVEFGAKDEKQTVKVNEKAVLKLKKLRKIVLEQKDRDFIRKHNLKDVLILKKIRDRRIARQKAVKFAIKKSQGWDDVDVDKYIVETDEGEHNVDELINKSPVRLEKVVKIAELTKQIQDINKKLTPEQKELIRKKIAERLKAIAERINEEKIQINEEGNREEVKENSETEEFSENRESEKLESNSEK